MKRLVNTARLLTLRALFAVGVLALLCVSDGVGPRLLPLPTAHERSDAASRAPSRGRTVARVEMVSGPQAQVAMVRQPQQQVAARTPNFIPPPPRLALLQGQDLRPHSREDSAHILRTQGRAPPSRLA